MRKLDPILSEKLVTLINSMGYELIGYELISQGRVQALRIYIDTEKGVSVDDCARVSGQVGAMLDVYGSFSGRYMLEVSSPGIDRPLFQLDHYRQVIGKEIKVKLYSMVEQRRQYKGLLKRVEGEDIYIILIDDAMREIKLPFSLIEKANVIGDVRF